MEISSARARNGRNPFRYGTPVVGDDFTSREEEIAQLSDLAKNNKSSLIQGSKRIGTTSLLYETARRLSRDFIFVHVSLLGIADESRLMDAFTREIVRAGIGKSWSIDRELWDMLSNKRMQDAVLLAGLPFWRDPSFALTDKAVLEAREGSSENPTLKVKMKISMCPKCGRPLRWVEKYERHYCYSCKKYAPLTRGNLPVDGILLGSIRQEDNCPTCGSELKFVHRYSEQFCPKCAKYPGVERNRPGEPWKYSEMVEALSLPQKLADLRDKPVVVMFDEFQELASFEGRDMPRAMRHGFDELDNVSFVFAGYDRQAMHQLFGADKSPFNKFAKEIVLNAIPEADLKKFLSLKFRSGGGRLSSECAAGIAGISEGIPYYAQEIAHEMFDLSSEPSESDLTMATEIVVQKHAQEFSVLWNSIRSPLHRRYLIAISRRPGVVRGKEFIEGHRLRSRSHVQRIETQIEERGITNNGELVDPLFVRWLRRGGP